MKQEGKGTGGSQYRIRNAFRPPTLPQRNTTRPAPNMPRALVVLLASLFIAICLLPSAKADNILYVYDSLGRIIQAVNATSENAATYQYDAAGNITSRTFSTLATLSLTEFTPSNGVPGNAVTIYGTGFNVDPNVNTVRFNGVTATVSSASRTQLVAIVPSGATTGPISITVGSSAVISTGDFLVYGAPTISGFSPKFVNMGEIVTLSGKTLNPYPGGTQISIGNEPTLINSISDINATFTPSKVNSGYLTVSTPLGSTTSTSALIVSPADIGAANITASAELITATPKSLELSPNKYGAFFFEGQAGQYQSIQISSLATVPSGAAASYRIYSPTNTIVASGTVSASNMSIHLPKALVAGTYLAAFSTGSSTATISAQLEVNSIFTETSPTLSISTAVAGQSKRFILPSAAGANIGAGAFNLRTTPSSVNDAQLTLYKPDGGTLAYMGCSTYYPGRGCNVWSLNLPQTGDYTVVVSSAAQMNFDLTVSQAAGGTLTPGTAQAVTYAPGQISVHTFTATTGQTVAVRLSSLVTTPASQNAQFIVYNQSGAIIANSPSPSDQTFNLRNLASGTYRVVVVPWYGLPASAQITLATGLVETIPIDASSRNFSTALSGQDAYFKFTGVAGQSIGVGVLNLATTPSSVNDAHLTLYRPDGSTLAYMRCYTHYPGRGCNVWSLSLPQTGEYTVVVSSAAQTSFNLTVSLATDSALSTGTPQAVTYVPGQFSVHAFTATPGETVAVRLSSLMTTPANQNAQFIVYNQSGAIIANNASPWNQTFNLTNLAAGTYRVVVVPWFGLPASAQVTLADGSVETIPVDASTRSFSTAMPGQNAYFKFAGTAGQNIGIGLLNLVTTPSSVNDAQLTLYKPDGGTLAYMGCSTYYPSRGCNVWSLNLPQTGDYTVVVSSAAQINFDLTASHAASGSLTSGTSQAVTYVPGQISVHTFMATTGQSMAVRLRSLVTTPVNQNAQFIVYNQSGAIIANYASSWDQTFNLTNLAAGTYRVVVVPWFGLPASAQVSYQ